MKSSKVALFFNYYPFLLMSGWLAGMLLVLGRSYGLAENHLVYTLDDPYIHLAVAETILDGGYGINAHEYSSPSSSMIYPLLLTVPLWMGFNHSGPLIVNLLAMMGAVFLVGLTISEHILTASREGQRGSGVFAFALGFCLLLIMNAFGLVMTGMEHSLHVLACVAVIYGFSRILDKQEAPQWWFILAIVLMPLIRFEGFAAALFSIGALWYLGFRFQALTALALIATAVMIWAGVMHHLGLPVLPSSVTLKSSAADVASRGSPIWTLILVWQQFFEAVTNSRRGMMLTILCLISAAAVLQQFRLGGFNRKRSVVFGLTGVAAGVAHLFLGKFGWFSRYEVYVVVSVVLSCLLLWRPYLRHVESQIFVPIFLLFISMPYVHTLMQTPRASRGIYEQQYQMGRFASEYWKKPVAVNDLGLVSYENPAFVLDLYGLGSEDVRKLKTTGTYHVDAVARLVDEHDVKLIMIYDDWFRDKIPKDWKKVAVLSAEAVSAASPDVSFYATPSANMEEVSRAIKAWQVSLPKRDKLRLAEVLGSHEK